MNSINESEQYFIRRRGRISGPFDHIVIEKMIKFKKLYKSDEISIDQEDWVVVGDTEFFPKSQNPNPLRGRDIKTNNRNKDNTTELEVNDTNSFNPETFQPQARNHPHPPFENHEWYYALSDHIIGPISEAELKLQIMLKTISPQTKVWSQGMPEWIEARSNAGFTQIFKASEPINEKISLDQSDVSIPGNILQGKYCVGCGTIISQLARMCPKCGSSQGLLQMEEDSKVKSSTIWVSYIVTSLFPIAGLVYCIYFLMKNRVEHAVGNIIIAVFSSIFWSAFFESFFKSLFEPISR